MKIKKLEVSNFRNLNRINVTFGDINILTGKNSSGKTNLTQLITNCINTDNKASNYFGSNITTHGQGFNKTTIKTTLEDVKYMIQRRTIGEQFKILKPTSFVFNHQIAKKTLSSTSQSLKYIGTEYSSNDVVGFLNSDEIKKLEKDFSKKSITVNFNFSNDITNTTENISGDIGSLEYFDVFKRYTENTIVNYDDNSSFSSASRRIYNFITKKHQNEKYKNTLDRLKQGEHISSRQSFEKAEFIDLLADIQTNIDIFDDFNRDLQFYTDGIIKKVEVNTDGSLGFKGDVFITTPHGPNDIEYLSAGSSIILYFVTIKNWLNIKIRSQSYSKPFIMIFDELDSTIHPSLLEKFSELLKIISKNIQLFITTHSANFIDNFSKESLYLLKDKGSLNNQKPLSNILSYSDIINTLGNNEKDIFTQTSNSELYINNYLESLFPIDIK